MYKTGIGNNYTHDELEKVIENLITKTSFSCVSFTGGGISKIRLWARFLLNSSQFPN